MADDSHLSRIDSKLDKVIEQVGKIHVTLARNTDSLEAHMLRTAIIERALLPIKRFWDFLVVAGQLLAAIGVLAAIVESSVAFLTYLGK